MEDLNLISQFDHVYILDSAVTSAVAKRALGLFPKEKISVVSEEPFSERKGRLSSSEFQQSKRLLYLAPFKGQFFKRCPGARPGLTCCNYFVLNLGLQCNMNCSYCYLQSFINSPVTKIYTNIDQALRELDNMSVDMGEANIRIGTGEVIDSLSLDPLTLYSVDLIRFFNTKPHWRLEFKTKSSLVDQFLDEPHNKNVIVSWSINPQYIIGREEHGTANLSERLAAARKCADKGFLVSFHIDPMIYHQDWQANYAKLVDQIVAQFRPDELPYLSVGTLRYQPEQRHMMRERFGMKSLVNSEEMFSGKDGKLRYDHSVRTEMYKFIVERFKAVSSKWNIFMCMETPETWLKSQGELPKNDPGLKDLFDHSVIRKAKASIKMNGVTQAN